MGSMFDRKLQAKKDRNRRMCDLVQATNLKSEMPVYATIKMIRFSKNKYIFLRRCDVLYQAHILQFRRISVSKAPAETFGNFGKVPCLVSF